MECNIPKDIINVKLSYRKETIFDHCENDFKKGNTDFILNLIPFKDEEIKFTENFTIIQRDYNNQVNYRVLPELYEFNANTGQITILDNTFLIQKAGKYSLVIICSDKNTSYEALYYVEEDNIDFDNIIELPEYESDEEDPIFNAWLSEYNNDKYNINYKIDNVDNKTTLNSDKIIENSNQIIDLENQITLLENQINNLSFVKIKGRVDTFEDLPSNPEIGDGYYIGLEGARDWELWIYTNTHPENNNGWIQGPTQSGDLSNFVLKDEQLAKDTAQDNQISQNLTNINNIKTSMVKSVNSKLPNLLGNANVDAIDINTTEGITTQAKMDSLQEQINNIEIPVYSDIADFSDYREFRVDLSASQSVANLFSKVHFNSITWSENSTDHWVTADNENHVIIANRDIDVVLISASVKRNITTASFTCRLRRERAGVTKTIADSLTYNQYQTLLSTTLENVKAGDIFYIEVYSTGLADLVITDGASFMSVTLIDKTSVIGFGDRITNIENSIDDINNNMVKSVNGILPIENNLEILSNDIKLVDDEEYTIYNDLSYLHKTKSNSSDLSFANLNDNDTGVPLTPALIVLGTDGRLKSIPSIPTGEISREEAIVFSKTTQTILGGANTEIEFSETIKLGDRFNPILNGIQVIQNDKDFDVVFKAEMFTNINRKSFPIDVTIELYKNGLATGIKEQITLNLNTTSQLKMQTKVPANAEIINVGDLFTLNISALKSNGQSLSLTDSITLNSQRRFVAIHQETIMSGNAFPQKIMTERYLGVVKSGNQQAPANSYGYISWDADAQFGNSDYFKFKDSGSLIEFEVSEYTTIKTLVTLHIEKQGAEGTTGKLYIKGKLMKKNDATGTYDVVTNIRNNQFARSIGSQGITTIQYDQTFSIKELGTYALQLYWKDMGGGSLFNFTDFELGREDNMISSWEMIRTSLR